MRVAKYDRKYSMKIYMENLKNTYEKIKQQIIGKRVPAYVNNIQLGNDTYFYDIILVSKQGPYTHYWEDLRNEFHKKSCNKLLDFINNKTSKLECLKGSIKKFKHSVTSQKRRNNPERPKCEAGKVLRKAKQRLTKLTDSPKPHYFR